MNEEITNQKVVLTYLFEAIRDGLISNKVKTGISKDEVLNWIETNELPLKMWACIINNDILVLRKFEEVK